MKVILKIIEYNPEKEKIVVKFCNSQSEKSIDEMKALTLNLRNLDTGDTELFLESLTIEGQRIINKYEQRQFGEIVENGPLDISKLVGKTIERIEFPKNKKMVPMRRIEL